MRVVTASLPTVTTTRRGVASTVEASVRGVPAVGACARASTVAEPAEYGPVPTTIGLMSILPAEHPVRLAEDMGLR